MVRISVEVSSGAACFRVSVQAQSIQRAVSLVGERYPNGNVRVKFPIDAESFFAKDSADRAGIAGRKQAPEMPEIQRIMETAQRYGIEVPPPPA